MKDGDGLLERFSNFRLSVRFVLPNREDEHPGRIDSSNDRGLRGEFNVPTAFHLRGPTGT